VGTSLGVGNDPPRKTSENERNDSGNGGGGVPPQKNLVQQLVQENEGIRGKIKNPGALGGDPSQWTLKLMEKDPEPNNDLYPYQDRYYLTFNDGSGSLVKISGNYDTNSRRWHRPTFHFSSDQPRPAKWGLDGTMRNPPDLGADENPILGDIDEFLDLFGG